MLNIHTQVSFTASYSMFLYVLGGIQCCLRIMLLEQGSHALYFCSTVRLYYHRLNVVRTETSNRRTIGLWRYVGRTKVVQQGEAWKEKLYEGKWKSNDYRNYTPESRGLSEKNRSKVVDDISGETWRQTGRIGSEWHMHEQAVVYLSIIKWSMTKESIYTQKSRYLNSYVVLGWFFVRSHKVLLSDRWCHISMKDAISRVLGG